MKSAPLPAKDQLNLELAEVREISEMMLKKIDAQVQRLEALEAAIDKKKFALERLIKQADERGRHVESSGGESALSDGAVAPAAYTRRLDILESRVKTNETLLSLAGKKIVSLEQSLLLQSDQPELRSSGMMRGQEIVALSEKGLASREIAEVLAMPQGEVDLILELKTH